MRVRKDLRTSSVRARHVMCACLYFGLRTGIYVEGVCVSIMHRRGARDDDGARRLAVLMTLIKVYPRRYRRRRQISVCVMRRRQRHVEMNFEFWEEGEEGWKNRNASLALEVRYIETNHTKENRRCM